jgi:hypothetical protein
MKICRLVFALILFLVSCKSEIKDNLREEERILSNVSFELFSRYMVFLNSSPPPPGANFIVNETDSVTKSEYIKAFKPFDFDRIKNRDDDYKFFRFFSGKRESLLHGEKILVVNDSLMPLDAQKVATYFPDITVPSKLLKKSYFDFSKLSVNEFCLLNYSNLDSMKEPIRYAGDISISNFVFNSDMNQAIFFCKYDFNPMLSIMELVRVNRNDCCWKITFREIVGGHHYMRE